MDDQYSCIAFSLLELKYIFTKHFSDPAKAVDLVCVSAQLIFSTKLTFDTDNWIWQCWLTLTTFTIVGYFYYCNSKKALKIMHCVMSVLQALCLSHQLR